jgi:hypothetical protein
MFIKESSYSKDEMIKELEDYGFEQSAPDEPYYDYFCSDGVTATVNLDRMEGYFTWNSPYGNGSDLGDGHNPKDSFDLESPNQFDNFLNRVHEIEEGYDNEWMDIVLQSHGFENVGRFTYEKVFDDRFETIQATYNTERYEGLIVKTPKDSDYDEEILNIDNFVDFMEELDI